MKPAVAEWVSKAEGDFATAGRELRARKFPNYDAVCFHSQQCAEKYLKAVNHKRIPKIYFLLELKAMLTTFDPSYEMLQADLETLEDYSVRYRYPGESAVREEAQAAFAAVKVVSDFIRQRLGLK